VGGSTLYSTRSSRTPRYQYCGPHLNISFTWRLFNIRPENFTGSAALADTRALLRAVLVYDIFFFCPCANDSTSVDKLIRFEGPRDFLHGCHSHDKLQPTDPSFRRLLQRLATRDELS